MKTVVEKYEENDLPLDVMWADIEYMNEYRNFEVKPGSDWDGLLPWVDSIQKKNIKFVPIVDAGFQASNDYPYYALGQEKGAFIRSYQYSNTEDPIKGTLIGKVWPGASAFLDWWHP